MTNVASIQKSSLPDIRRLLDGWCCLWDANDLAAEIRVEISTRMTRSLGRCYPDRKLIRIATFVVEESEELFQEVLCHEAAHLAAYQLHGKSIRPHGREWKALMLMAGYEPHVRYKGAILQPQPAVTARKPRLIDLLLGPLEGNLISRVRSVVLNRRAKPCLLPSADQR